MSTFGNWLGEEVKELKISKQELAEIAGLSKTCVIQVICGTILDPSKEVRKKLEMAIFGLNAGTISYHPVTKKNKKGDTLKSGELARYLVAGINRYDHTWEVIGVYADYDIACQVAGYYLPARGCSDKYADAFVWRETDF